eukprot:1050490-Rhodomonas_salina.2
MERGSSKQEREKAENEVSSIRYTPKSNTGNRIPGINRSEKRSSAHRTAPRASAVPHTQCETGNPHVKSSPRVQVPVIVIGGETGRVCVVPSQRMVHCDVRY